MRSNSSTTFFNGELPFPYWEISHLGSSGCQSIASIELDALRPSIAVALAALSSIESISKLSPLPKE
jgi:hypothetical protein